MYVCVYVCDRETDRLLADFWWNRVRVCVRARMRACACVHVCICACWILSGAGSREASPSTSGVEHGSALAQWRARNRARNRLLVRFPCLCQREGGRAGGREGGKEGASEGGRSERAREGAQASDLERAGARKRDTQTRARAHTHTGVRAPHSGLVSQAPCSHDAGSRACIRDPTLVCMYSRSNTHVRTHARTHTQSLPLTHAQQGRVRVRVPGVRSHRSCLRAR